MLADEPTGALDSANGEAVMRLILTACDLRVPRRMAAGRTGRASDRPPAAGLTRGDLPGDELPRRGSNDQRCRHTSYREGPAVPPDDPIGERVTDRGEPEHALATADAGGASDPQPVRRDRGEVPIHQVRRRRRPAGPDGLSELHPDVGPGRSSGSRRGRRPGRLARAFERWATNSA